MSQSAIKILQKTDVDKLPTLPHVLLRLLDICHDESPSFIKLANILRLDPGLYARIYTACDRKNCNKTIQTASEMEPTIEQALQNLGINTIKSIAVTAAVQQFFSGTSPEQIDFLKQHWQHSTYCATVAQSIAKHCSYSNPDEAYTTGLLHDIGQLALEAAFPEKYTSTFAQLSEDEYFHTLEKDEFKANHQQLGAELLKKHGTNSFIYDAVLYHHEATDQLLDAHPLVKIINLANTLTCKYFREQDQQVFDDAEILLGLDKALLLEILEKSKLYIINTAETLDIRLTLDGIDGKTERHQKATDEFKQAQLAEQVRNIAMLDGLHQHLSRKAHNSENPQALLSVLSQYAGILFGVDQSILFLYDATSDRIQAVAPNQQSHHLSDISIPLTSGRSLVTDALLNKQACHSFNDKIAKKDAAENVKTNLSVIDRQLLGITQRKGIICLPMMINNAAVGTLILGVDNIQFEYLWKQQAFLMHFANEVAHTVSANHIPKKPSSEKNSTQQLKQRIHEVLHEVRNPLSIMNNYLSILSYKLESDKPAQDDVETIKSEIERISLILSRFTDEESSAEAISQVDINAIIADLTHVFQTSLFASKSIQISLDLDERINALPSNANTLKQIYTNLIKNAVEALPANGQLMVYTQDNVNVDGQQHIELSVADNGPGIDPGIMPKLFSAVESTKGSDHAGLGLTIVKNLVSDLHGSISCRSSDKGTSFHILLPK
jgi:putative nucleotidyltransferase with HDIG domain